MDIHTENQNQRIEQNPVIKPVIPAKTGIKYWVVLAVVISTGLVLIGGLYIFRLKDTNVASLQQINEPVQAPPASAPSAEVVTTPVENTLYLGTYNNSAAIFFTNEEKQEYFENGVPNTSEYIGDISMADNSGIAPFDFKKLQSPRRIFTSSQKIHSENNFVLNESDDLAYVSLNYEIEDDREFPNLINRIIQIKLDTLESTEVWSNKIGSNKYEGGEGPVYLRANIGDKFLISEIINCYECEGSPAGTIILNTNTKQEKFFSNIGNIQFNIQDNTFSYQKLASLQESCNPSPVCDNGKKTVMKPAGQIYTEDLP